MGNAFLPGTEVTLNDLGLKVAPPPAGPKVTLLGITSNSGIPIREPFTVSSVEKAINTLYFSTGTFGTTSGRFPGELALAMEQAVNAGATNIEVMVIGHQSGDALLNYISLTGSQTGRYIDLSGAYDVLRNRELEVVVPVGARIDLDADAAGNNFGKQLANFCFQATQESNSCVGVISPSTVLEWAWRNRRALETAQPVAGAVLSGSITGTITGQSSSVFSGELASLFGDTLARDVKFKNMYFATPSTDLTNYWYKYNTLQTVSADPCATLFEYTGSITSFTRYNSYYSGWLMGNTDINGLRLDNATNSNQLHPSYFTFWQAVDSAGTAAVDSRSVKVDAGAFISVFTAPIAATSTQTRQLAGAFGASLSTSSYNTPGDAAYAGTITSLAPQSATTNKFVPGIIPLKYLSVSQANILSGFRHVTMYSRSKGFVVSLDSTGAHNVNNYLRSDYARLTTVRIVQSAVDLIRALSEKYIGEPNNAPQLNALNSEIEQALSNMKSVGALRQSDFTISATPDQRVLGQLDINLTLVPAFEITKINLIVSLAKEL